MMTDYDERGILETKQFKLVLARVSSDTWDGTSLLELGYQAEAGQYITHVEVFRYVGNTPKEVESELMLAMGTFVEDKLGVLKRMLYEKSSRQAENTQNS